MAEEVRRVTHRFQFDPLIRGMMNRLPKPGTVWPKPERKAWLATLEANFELIYDEAEQEKPAGAPHAIPQTRAV